MSNRRWVEDLYRKHAHAVFHRARRLLGNDEDARDTMHDVFLNLYRDRDGFTGASSIATYLYSMTTHACLNRLRNGRTRAQLLAVEAAAWTTAVAPAGEGRTLAREILDALSPEDAALAIYLYCDELSREEVAEILGCTRRNVGYLAERLAQRIAKLTTERGCA